MFLKRNLAPKEITDVIVQLDNTAADFTWIRCPLCHWRPEASSRWYCTLCGPPEYFFEGCGTVWNTFTTRGLCPGCGHQWRWTACLSCGGWSLHEDWYATEID
ncbi:MAG: hypothetical protein HS126_08465 [Anaerolineales bacterium]|nr:hypothetical protein [Anaerolineales bacterium]